MIDHIFARPCGSKMRNKTIKDPNIIKLKCSTVAALIGIPSNKGKFVIKMGTRTIKAAPMNAPEILPILIEQTKDNRSICDPFLKSINNIID